MTSGERRGVMVLLGLIVAVTIVLALRGCGQEVVCNEGTGVSISNEQMAEGVPEGDAGVQGAKVKKVRRGKEGRRKTAADGNGGGETQRRSPLDEVVE